METDERFMAKVDALLEQTRKLDDIDSENGEDAAEYDRPSPTLLEPKDDELITIKEFPYPVENIVNTLKTSMSQTAEDTEENLLFKKISEGISGKLEETDDLEMPYNKPSILDISSIQKPKSQKKRKGILYKCEINILALNMSNGLNVTVPVEFNFELSKRKTEKKTDFLQYEKEEKLKEECTFKPKINATTTDKKKKSEPFFERAMLWKKRRNSQTQKLLEEKEQFELANCSFKPKINQIFKGKSYTDVHTKLYMVCSQTIYAHCRLLKQFKRNDKKLNKRLKLRKKKRILLNPKQILNDVHHQKLLGVKRANPQPNEERLLKINIPFNQK